MIASKRGDRQNTIILDFQPIRRNVNAQIGDPKKVEDYRLSNLVNNTGDDSIPLPYFSQEKKNMEEEELENTQGPEFDREFDTFQKFLFESKEKNMGKEKLKEKSEEKKGGISEQGSDTPSFAAPILGAYKKKVNPFETNVKLDKIFNVPQSISGQKEVDTKRTFEQTPIVSIFFLQILIKTIFISINFMKAIFFKLYVVPIYLLTIVCSHLSINYCFFV